nr:hypothetical protein [Tanacetum cinerariifolium]
MCVMVGQFIKKKQEEKQIEEQQAAKAQNLKIPACYDDDDDCNFAITPNEPVDPLSMGVEHLNTIPATKLDEFIKSSVGNLIPNPNILEKIFSNPLFHEEIISMKIDPHHFNAESILIESLLNHDSSIISSSLKIDSHLDEFAVNSLFLKQFRQFVSKNSNAEIKSFSPSPIPIKDSDSLMEEIDLSFTPDDPMPPGIEDDDYDSERDILILEELLDNYSLSLPEIESYDFDIPSFFRLPAKLSDGNTGILNIRMMGDISEQKVPMPRLVITLVSNQEKSPDLLSHRSRENFKPSAKWPMMIHGKNTPILDVHLFHFYPLDQLKYRGNWVKLSDLKQGLRGRHPMLIRSLAFRNE